METFSFRCSRCGRTHEGLPDLAFRTPLFWNEPDDPGETVERYLGEDLCILGEHRFIRCTLTVPIMGIDSRLGWGVWVSQSVANFELYKSQDGSAERTTVGYLANRLPIYADTLNMIVQTHWQTDGLRPWVEPEPSDHALYQDWSNGISLERAVAFAELLVHRDDRDSATITTPL